ncbi:molecular chaperone HtpG [Sneathiella sp. HT1-7]|jgi:molecular chaperone HtpG|uniref:molecular chaperone HtpG n=1 Tax=Sneathiella sp. HT1-7 TaxID=2887192 RepID=UPI001D13428C|nr:molecular chaperone HtpG [Sneathiella sp. HT1-7]MCC3303675.1 molecular chaperone HtpG [Sneathiella sp. HT1-7]
MTEQTHEFQAEVAKLLDIVTHSLYSEKEIFLRELVSNASDACDRLRYEALTNPDLIKDDPEFKITISIDEKARTLTIEDNGIGMSEQDMIDNLGTIARSGTSRFSEQLTGDASKDVTLIGQFGVGFYSAFMVADKVTVTSRRAGEETATVWSSEGHGSFAVEPGTKETRGTQIVLHMRKEAKEYLESARLRQIIKTYADHIAIPVILKSAAQGEEDETLNSASALWTRQKSEITPEQYTEFYHHVGQAFDTPWLTLHSRAEGRIEYTMLLFVPEQPPFDLFNPERKSQLKLYVKRVFITDDCEELIPAYLRFLRGVVDSEDLPLNVSREMLQHNPVLQKIRSGLIKKVLGELEKKATKDTENFAKFWGNFGAVLKEGIYEDTVNGERILKMSLFNSTGQEERTNLADYIGRMKEGQDAIYYITGEDLEALKSSPQLEGFAAKGIEVLLLADAVDSFWLSRVNEFDGKPFKSVTRGGSDLDKIADAEEKAEETDKTPPGDMDSLIALFKTVLENKVKDVRISSRLTGSPVCLVADEGDMDIHLEKLLKAHKQFGASDNLRILEINPKHPLIKKLAKNAQKNGSSTSLEDAALLLLDQAHIVEGDPVANPVAFSKRMADFMANSISN